MKTMADLDAVHLGLDENEADIAEELQHFDNPFNTDSDRSEEELINDSDESDPSFSSIESMHSSDLKSRIVYKSNAVITKSKVNKVPKKMYSKTEKDGIKRMYLPAKQSDHLHEGNEQSIINGKNSNKNKRLPTGSIMKNCVSSESKIGNLAASTITLNTPISNSDATINTTASSDIESKKTDSIEFMKLLTKKNINMIINQGNVGTNPNKMCTNAMKIACNKSEITDEDQNKQKMSFDSESGSENSDMPTTIKRNGRKTASMSNSNEKKLITGSLASAAIATGIESLSTMGTITASISSSQMAAGNIPVSAVSLATIASAVVTPSIASCSATAPSITTYTASNNNVHGGDSISGSGGCTTGTKNASMYDFKTKLNYLFRDTRFFLIKSNNADNVLLAKNQNVWATLPQNDTNLNQAFKEARNILLIFSVNESGKYE